MELGEQIATLREEQALTQVALAEAARISPSTLSQIESGKVPSPHVGTVRKLARALGVEPADLRRTKEPVLTGRAPAPPSPLPAEDTEERRGAGEAAKDNLEAFRKAQEAFGELLRRSGTEPRYITMPHALLEALYNNASLEEAQEITAVLIAERRALAEHHPDAKFPGKRTFAIYLSLFTAAVGMGSVAEREAAVAREAGEEERVRHIHKELDLAKQALTDAA